MRKLATALTLSLLTTFLYAQETWPTNGTLEKGSTVYVLENAIIHVSADEVTTGSLLVENGRIIAVGVEPENIRNAVRIDLSGHHLYASFIDLMSEYGMPEIPRQKRERGPQFTSNKKGAYGWNESIRPEVRAAEDFTHKEEKAAVLRKAGFGTLLVHEADGIARGTGSLISLGSQDNTSLLVTDAAAFYSFKKGSSNQDYPSSLMGAIALLRQTYYDASWYKSSLERDESNLSLEAWINNEDLPQVFITGDRLDVLRADKIGDEFGVQYIFKGNGDEYQRIDAMKATGASFIVPLNFPTAFDVSDPYLSRMIGLDELKHWELAPSNLGRLEKAGIPFAATAEGLKDPSMIVERLRKCIEHGLSVEGALRSITETPASMMGVDDLVGCLKTGLIANFIVTDGELFDHDTRILENWVQGQQHVLIDWRLTDLSGTYALTFSDHSWLLNISGEAGKHKGEIQSITTTEEGVDTSMIQVKIQQQGDILSLQFGPKDGVFNGVFRLNGNAFGSSRIWKGRGEDPTGKWFDWAAVKEEDAEETLKPDPSASTQSTDSTTIVYPFVAYGWQEQPEIETLLITNATIWTCEEEGVIENGQLLIADGKIKAVGSTIDLTAIYGRTIPTIQRYDARGAHVTPGIIDEHSHIAISRGVNEGTQASSAEVSIATVVNSEDVNIYRQLSGGVTAAQLLHGSANPVGGQSGIIKLRWGLTPDQMLIRDADPFIKFALGENVKQSNWGDDQRERFPQTRMGVEQVYYDLFIRAREYEAEWNKYNAEIASLTRRQRKKGMFPIAPRRDLELETLLQILNSERFVTCHSYRQDEINMLMHVADSMGFTLNTFTHILEGYKVADKMAAHGAGGSSFSDWWAYKFEVKDAIPYNGAILWEQGITTAFNSDDAEMARRLNQEAAKAVKYGGVPEEEALKFVTLNPAKLLHLDHRMGSIKVGKDADIVIWTDHPLSIYAKAKTTFIDGRRYFDIDRDEAMRESMRTERARLVQKMLSSEAPAGDAKKKPKENVPHFYHCDTETEEIR